MSHTALSGTLYMEAKWHICYTNIEEQYTRSNGCANILTNYVPVLGKFMSIILLGKCCARVVVVMVLTIGCVKSLTNKVTPKITH